MLLAQLALKPVARLRQLQRLIAWTAINPAASIIGDDLITLWPMEMKFRPARVGFNKNHILRSRAQY
jgi:hypothetical protein